MKAIQRHPVVAFLALTMTLSWGLYSLVSLPGGLGLVAADNPAGGLLLVLKQCSPTIAGLTLALALGGKAGLRRVTRTALRWRAGIGWYALVLIGLPGILILGSGIRSLITGHPLRLEGDGASLVLSLVGLVLLAGVSEELYGWRGFALPKLLDRVGPVTASVIIGVLWSLWHTPPWGLVAQGVSVAEAATSLSALVGMSLVMTWVYLKSGSALLAGLGLHGVFNGTGFIVSGDAWAGDWAMVACGCLAAAGLVVRSHRERASQERPHVASALVV